MMGVTTSELGDWARTPREMNPDREIERLRKEELRVDGADGERAPSGSSDRKEAA